MVISHTRIVEVSDEQYHGNNRQASFGWLAGCQPAVLFSHTNSAPATSHQQYFSLTTNQHQPTAISQPNEAKIQEKVQT
jgi:hypothetical protein